MFSHIMVGADNIEEAKTFYDAILGALGYQPGTIDEKGRCFYFTKYGIFAITKPIDNEAATPANGGTIGFSAKSPEQCEAFHEAGLANGGSTCESPPGVRESGLGKLYVAYLRDPTGNKICVLHQMKL
ncbi:MAG: VOC family protein [Pseudomonadales bacterium]|nr:VOC family protein [Pseudomonadales bacterium]